MKIFFKYSIFTFFIIALVLTGLEVTSRLYDWLSNDSLKKVGEETLAFNANDLNPYVFFRSLPSLEIRPNNNFFFIFNGKTVHAEKDFGEYRIFILGGSVAQGYGASTPEKRFYSLLEQKLKKIGSKSRRFNIISAGRLGYVSGQELILLMMGVLDFSPDLVIHLNGANDILAVLQYKEKPGYPFYFQTLNRALKSVKIGKVINQTLNRSSFLQDLQNMFKKYKVSTDSLTGKNITRHYIRNMKQSTQLLKANASKVMIILQPTIFNKKVKSLKEQMQRSSQQNIQFWGKTYQHLDQSLKDISRQEKIVSQNLVDIFNSVEDSIFKDSLHLNDRGQEILANTLFEIIQKNILTKNKN